MCIRDRYIKGFNIDDKEGLLKDGYDLEEIGSKLIDNYIRQVIEDGFCLLYTSRCV